MENCTVSTVENNQSASRFLLNNIGNLLISVALMTIVLAIIYALDLNQPSTIGEFATQNHLVVVLIVSVLLMFICAMTPAPAEAITVSNGIIFGPFAGTVITWLSAMVGAYIAFLWGRRHLSPVKANLAKQQNFQKIQGWINKWGIPGFLCARLIPVVPFFALNFGAALLPISVKNYLLITGIAILPHIMIICFLSGHFGAH